MVLSVLTVVTVLCALYLTTKATEIRLNSDDADAEFLSSIAFMLWLSVAAELLFMLVRLL